MSWYSEFVPQNPLTNLVRGMFLDETTADVCFQVRCVEDEEKDEVPASELFHAHSQILKACAPMLAILFNLDNSDGKIATATITDVKPDIFRHLLYYVYGGSVPVGELKTHAKDIIEAADKYAIVNLKLEAEVAYKKYTAIKMDNVIDELLYADAKNCPLLKEAVMNFLAVTPLQASEELSFKDVPGHLMKDLLVAVGGQNKRNSRADKQRDELTSLSVSALRRKLYEMDLDIDGSREAMIESIRNNSS